MDFGILGDTFDFNNDGNLDAFEQGLEFVVIDEMTKDSDDYNDEL